MTEERCGWIQEEMIDELLGKLPERKRTQLRAHLRSCADCRRLYREWQAILPAGDPLPVPTPDLRRSLRLQVVRQKVRGWIVRPYVWGGLAACLIAAVMLLGALKLSQPFTYSQPAVERIEGSSLMHDPQAVLYPVDYPSQPRVKGYIWLNGSSNRMLLLIEGLSPSEDRDYQAWAGWEGGYANMGLLKYSQGMSHLYIEGLPLRKIDNIIVSIEPKGGSRTPTQPETVILPVKMSEGHVAAK
jgi:hypothetical protein